MNSFLIRGKLRKTILEIIETADSNGITKGEILFLAVPDFDFYSAKEYTFRMDQAVAMLKLLVNTGKVQEQIYDSEYESWPNTVSVYWPTISLI